MRARIGIEERLKKERFLRNVLASLVGWAIVNTIFYIEVRHFDVGRQAAHVSKTPIGAPLGFMIQWIVFGDRVKAIIELEGKRPKLELAVRWVISKAPFFFLNQALFWALVLWLGMPFVLTPFVIPPIASAIHYFVDDKWTYAFRQVELQAEPV